MGSSTESRPILTLACAIFVLISMLAVSTRAQQQPFTDEEFEPCVKVADLTTIDDPSAEDKQKCCNLLMKSIKDSGTTVAGNKFCNALTNSRVKPSLLYQAESQFEAIRKPCTPPYDTMLGIKLTPCAQLPRDFQIDLSQQQLFSDQEFQPCVEVLVPSVTSDYFSPSEEDTKKCCKLLKRSVSDNGTTAASNKFCDSLMGSIARPKTLDQAERQFEFIGGPCPAPYDDVLGVKRTRCANLPLQNGLEECYLQFLTRTKYYAKKHIAHCCLFIEREAAKASGNTTQLSNAVCDAFRSEKETVTANESKRLFRFIRESCPNSNATSLSIDTTSCK